MFIARKGREEGEEEENRVVKWSLSLPDKVQPVDCSGNSSKCFRVLAIAMVCRLEMESVIELTDFKCLRKAQVED